MPGSLSEPIHSGIAVAWKCTITSFVFGGSARALRTTSEEVSFSRKREEHYDGNGNVQGLTHWDTRCNLTLEVYPFSSTTNASAEAEAGNMPRPGDEVSVISLDPQIGTGSATPKYYTCVSCSKSRTAQTKVVLRMELESFGYDNLVPASDNRVTEVRPAA